MPDTAQEKTVGVTGIEPVTLSLSGTRSNRLSYTPDYAEASSGKPLESRPKRAARIHPPVTGSPAVALAKAGGGNRVRTGDPELAKLVLCQLSYAPNQSSEFAIQNQDNRKNYPSVRPSPVTDDHPTPLRKSPHNCLAAKAV